MGSGRLVARGSDGRRNERSARPHRASAEGDDRDVWGKEGLWPSHDSRLNAASHKRRELSMFCPSTYRRLTKADSDERRMMPSAYIPGPDVTACANCASASVIDTVQGAGPTGPRRTRTSTDLRVQRMRGPRARRDSGSKYDAGPQTIRSRIPLASGGVQQFPVWLRGVGVSLVLRDGPFTAFRRRAQDPTGVLRLFTSAQCYRWESVIFRVLSVVLMVKKVQAEYEVASNERQALHS
ncbi:hypothetical protein C8Q74DRAFT_1394122 [Fomes fomentarius]|nr:hypothetical protein C8Q74DRAFT_1394122 [Fomes fomentarius]